MSNGVPRTKKCKPLKARDEKSSLRVIEFYGLDLERTNGNANAMSSHRETSALLFTLL